MPERNISKERINRWRDRLPCFTKAGSCRTDSADGPVALPGFSAHRKRRPQSEQFAVIIPANIILGWRLFAIGPFERAKGTQHGGDAFATVAATFTTALDDRSTSPVLASDKDVVAVPLFGRVRGAAVS